jgi:hypothetical protein
LCYLNGWPNHSINFQDFSVACIFNHFNFGINFL